MSMGCQMNAMQHVKGIQMGQSEHQVIHQRDGCLCPGYQLTISSNPFLYIYYLFFFGGIKDF